MNGLWVGYHLTPHPEEFSFDSILQAIPKVIRGGRRLCKWSQKVKPSWLAGLVAKNRTPRVISQIS